MSDAPPDFGAPPPFVVPPGAMVTLADTTPAPLSYTIRTLAWRRRLTDAEIGGVTLAASRAMEAGDPTLQVFLDDLGRATEVDLADPHFLGGLRFVSSVGLIDPSRITALTAPAAPEEQPT